MALPNANYDITIGGNGFFYAIDDNDPHVRQTNDFKRQQIDTSKEPGEQTLSQWWIRAQDSWHRGAGIQNYEPGSNQETEYRFASSAGVDIWTEGQVSEGPALTFLAATPTPNAYVSSGRYGGADYVFATNNGVLTRYNAQSLAATAYTGAPTSVLTEPVLAGTTVLVGGNTQIMSGSATGSTLTALWTGATGTLQPTWVKGRILAMNGANLYELTTAGGVVPATPTFTCPIPGGTFQCVAEAPDCILVTVNAGGRGYIYRIALVEGTTTGSSPTLGALTQVAEMPPGEEIFALKVYLGSFVALGTKYGVRIGDLGDNGKISYGPLSITTGRAVQALTFNDSFVYVGINFGDLAGFNAGYARIDLSQEILNFSSTNFASRTQRYAWNFDSFGIIGNAGTGDLVSITYANGRVFLVTSGTGSGVSGAIQYTTSTTRITTGAILTTGRLRFGTVELKNFAFLRIGATIPSGGSILIKAIDPSGATTTVATLTSSTDLTQDIPFPAPYTTNAYAHITLSFTLAGTNPILEFVQVKATPLPKIQRLIQYPLRLADFEQDRQGLEVGADGSAWTRLQALEALEAAGSLTTVVDNTNGETFSGQIQKVQFVRDTPPSRNNKNYGGRVILTVLKV